MNRYEENKKIVDAWLEKHTDDETVKVEISEGARYMMASEYLAGYNDGRFEAMNKLMDKFSNRD